MMHGATLAWAATAVLGGLASAANMSEWQSRSIYQVMTDRFARTDGSTTAPCTDLSVFCNGTWAGLTKKLDYIQGMGFTAIQISPVVKNIENETIVGDAYHGYWSEDLFQLNEHFGSATDLQTLIGEVHKRGMYILVDVVVNNMAQAFNNTWPPTIDYSKMVPFNTPDDYHPYCNVTNWGNPTDYQNCWLYPLGVALVDLKTESPVVVNGLGSWVHALVQNYSIDGVRIDAAKHVNDAFLPDFVKAAGVFALGEVFTGGVEAMCRYQSLGLLQGMPNSLQYYPIIEAFNGGSMVTIASNRSAALDACNNTLALGTFAENHDLPRFASYNQDMAIAKNAMTFVLMNDGMPLVYQGQEQHFNGAITPANREAVWTSGYNTSSTLYVLTAKLNKLRNHVIAAAPSYVTMTAMQLIVDSGHLCMAKGPAGSQIVFCINNKSSKGPSYSMSVGGFAPGDQVIEVLGCTMTTADATGNITAYFGRGEPKVYALGKLVNATGLCNSTQDAGEAAKQQDNDNAAGALKAMSGAALAVVLGWAVLLL